MIGADVLLQCLIKEKVDVVFGYPGGVTIPLHDRFRHYPKIKHILPRHEQGAGMAADAYFRVTGRPGVCLATSGPGATNLVTGIANAYMDSIGMVAITCQVTAATVGTDAFQEVDITGITLPITKQNYFVTSAKDLPRILKEAFYLASTGRPGPVHIDIPVNVLKETVTSFIYPKKASLPGYSIPDKASEKDINNVIALLQKASRPVIIAGHGVIISKAWHEFKKFIEKTNIPVTSTLLALGCCPSDHPLNCGMLGMHGMVYANYAIHHADLIMAIGSRFDDRITGDLNDFAKNAKVIHIDIDPAEIGKRVKVDIPLVGDCKKILEQLNKKVPSLSYPAWMKQIAVWKKKYSLQEMKKIVTGNKKQLSVQDVVQEVSSIKKGNSFVTSDVGQNQMWTAQYFDCAFPGQLLSSGGLGCMGYSLPASIGVQFAKPDAQVWSLMGDGGFQMNMQELGTIMEQKLPIKIIIFHNGYLGMVRQWQELFYQKNYAATPIKNPDFVKLAEAYGIEAYRVKTLPEVKKIIQKAHGSKKAMLIECMVTPENNVLPMVPAGQSLKNTVITVKKTKDKLVS